MKQFLDGRLNVICGDITNFEVEAIVNAANSSLMGGGGVDGAIHAAGGPEILAECEQIRSKRYPEGLPLGRAVITGAGDMAASYVIHTVGPIWKGGANREPEILESAYKSCLELADETGIKTIAFPAISTGIYGFPKEKAASIVARVMRQWINQKSMPREISLVYFSETDASLFIRVMEAG